MANIGSFRLTISTRQANYVASQLSAMPHKIPQVLAGAINKTLLKVRTYMVRSIREATTLKYGRILDKADIDKANPSKLHGKVVLAGRAVGAIQYKHTASRTNGVTVTMMKGDSPIRFRGGFKAFGIKGNQQLFYRVLGSYYKVGDLAHDKRNIGRRKERQKAIYGPSLDKIFLRHPTMRTDSVRVGSETFEESIMNQVDRALGRKKSDRPK